MIYKVIEDNFPVLKSDKRKRLTAIPVMFC